MKTILIPSLILASLFLITSVYATTNIMGNIINESGGSFNCYNMTNPISDLECTIGNSSANFFGTALIASIFVLAIGVGICWKTHLPLDLSAIFIISLLLVANIAFGVPTWVTVVLIIFLMLVVALGFYHWLHSRG
jgi:hypothetical protein